MQVKVINLFILVVMIMILGGCAGKDQNKIDNAKINEVRNGGKAMVLIQTTPTVFSSKFLSVYKKIETKWINLVDKNKSIETKNYRSIYVPPDLYLYDYYNIEVYVVSPGEYGLRQIKYMQGEGHSYTFRTSENVANFSVKAGDILYIGNLAINIKDNINTTAHYFFKNALSIQDNYNTAKIFLNNNYPDLSSKLQKRLVTLN